jgi:hypothetical protein
MKPNTTADKLGLPIKNGPVRFCVGAPDSLTSNSWRIWTTGHNDAYIVCRDNFKEAKVSLHASGRWRMGFTEEAVATNPLLVSESANRAWDVWDEPPTTLPETVVAFKLSFPTSELAVLPEQRGFNAWKNVIFIEPAPTGKVIVATLFVTSLQTPLRHETEPSLCLASLDLSSDRRIQLIVHGEPETDLPQLIRDNVRRARSGAEDAGLKLPEGSYGYFFGRQDSGCRFIVGARLHTGSHTGPGSHLDS